MVTVLGNSAVHGGNEVRIAPCADSVLHVWGYVATVERAEGQLERCASSIRRLPRNGMAGDAIACGRKVRTSRYLHSLGPNVSMRSFRGIRRRVSDTFEHDRQNESKQRYSD